MRASDPFLADEWRELAPGKRSLNLRQGSIIATRRPAERTTKKTQWNSWSDLASRLPTQRADIGRQVASGRLTIAVNGTWIDTVMTVSCT